MRYSSVSVSSFCEIFHNFVVVEGFIPETDIIVKVFSLCPYKEI